MNNKKLLTVFTSIIILLGLFLTGCGQNNNSSNQKASLKTEEHKDKNIGNKQSTNLKNQIQNKQIWYIGDQINYHSKSGIDAFVFHKNNIVNVYNSEKMYAQNDNHKRLNKQGQAKYQVINNGKNTQKIRLTGKLDGVPTDQTIKVNSKISGKNDKTNVKVHGFNIKRDVDSDVNHNVMVTPNT